MIKYTTLNKSKPKILLLIHGLFASSGYWLPYLNIFREYKLIILDIDYRKVSDIDQYVSRVFAIIEAHAGGAVDAIISHSLGTLIASRLTKDVRHFSFEICPVYCATRCNADNFVNEIERKIKFSMSISEIWWLLSCVDRALAGHEISMHDSSCQKVYLPDKDSYFLYDVRSEFKEFRGDHFNIAEAVMDIGKVLANELL